MFTRGMFCVCVGGGWGGGGGVLGGPSGAASTGYCAGIAA
jgi:hypothetical protein